MSRPWTATLSPAEVADVYERLGRSVRATARGLAIHESTVRARLRAYHGSAEKVPKAPLRSSSAAIGRAFEHRVRDALTAADWWVVRAAGSKGAADLVAFRRRVDWGYPEAVLVNVKRGGSVPVDEWNALVWLADEVGVRAIVALMPKGLHGQRGGIQFMQIVGLKSHTRGKRQPWKPWSPEYSPHKPRDNGMERTCAGG